jgi:hypothetical protein
MPITVVVVVSFSSPLPLRRQHFVASISSPHTQAATRALTFHVVVLVVNTHCFIPFTVATPPASD